MCDVVFCLNVLWFTRKPYSITVLEKILYMGESYKGMEFSHSNNTDLNCSKWDLLVEKTKGNISYRGKVFTNDITLTCHFTYGETEAWRDYVSKVQETILTYIYLLYHLFNSFLMES